MDFPWGVYLNKFDVHPIGKKPGVVFDQRPNLSYGKILYMQARFEDAEVQFQEFLQRDPEHPNADEAVTMLEAIAELQN